MQAQPFSLSFSAAGAPVGVLPTWSPAQILDTKAQALEVNAGGAFGVAFAVRNDLLVSRAQVLDVLDALIAAVEAAGPSILEAS